MGTWRVVVGVLRSGGRSRKNSESLECFQDLALTVQMRCRGCCALVLCGNYFLSMVSYKKNVSESLVSFIKMMG